MKRGEGGKRMLGQSSGIHQAPHRVNLRRSRDSSRHRHSRVSNRPWFLGRLFPILGLGSVGVVVLITVYHMSSLDGGRQGSPSFGEGFHYGEGNVPHGDNIWQSPPVGAVKDGGSAREASPQTSSKPSPHELQGKPPVEPKPEAGDNRQGSPDLEGGLKELIQRRQAAKGEANDEERIKARKPFGRSGDYREDGGDSTGKSGADNNKGFSRKTSGGWLGGSPLNLGEASLGNIPFELVGEPEEQEEIPAPLTRVVRHEGFNVAREGGTDFGDGGVSAVRGLSKPVARAPVLGRDTVLLVICAVRADYLRRTLGAVERFHPSREGDKDVAMPIVISQDGRDQAVSKVIGEFQDSMKERADVVHIRHPREGSLRGGYYLLSAHYAWALEQVFDHLVQDGYDFRAVDKVIILEDDLEIAPDFFDYFAATAPLLDLDLSLMAVSAWNDNGQATIVEDNQVVYRSDFFPGLGWMLPRRVWEELCPMWPQAYWDDWLREPARRKGRQFLRPEVCRTYHFGKKGTSNNQFASHLDNIKLNQDPVAFREMDMSFLEPEAFREHFVGRVEAAPVASVRQLVAGQCAPGDVRIVYSSKGEFESIARQLGIMADMKADVPRTAYLGIVTLSWKGARVFVTPVTFDSRLS